MYNSAFIRVSAPEWETTSKYFYIRRVIMSDSKKKLSRHEQRIAVFKLIFEHSFRQDESAADIFLADCEERGYSDYPFIRDTFTEAEKMTPESDEIIKTYAVGWSLDRLSNTAKALLKLSIYELLHTDTPPKVVINEAVEISKEYATEDEASFINGILNKVARDKGFITDRPTGEE